VIDYAHTEYAEQQRTAKAKTLARWCYQHGIGPGVAEQPDSMLREIARLADVACPHRDPAGRWPTWEAVAQLLRARADWDAAHGVHPPEPVRCIGCTVLSTPCPPCAARFATCASCSTRMDPVLLAEGLAVHPSCPEPERTASSGASGVAQPAIF
jgi:hypothetical protein